jgi:hypothetical protein
MKNKIVAVGTLSLITLLSFGKNFTNANADLIPSDYDYAYKQDFSDYWRVHNQVNNQYDTPIFTRTGTSPFYNYNIAGTSVELPFSVAMTFRLSDSPTWASSGGGYRPGALSDSSIGSTSGSGAIKVEFDFNNTSGFTYLLRIDMETATNITGTYSETFDSVFTYTRTSGTGFYSFVIPAYTNFKFAVPSVSTVLFNGWFLNLIDSDFVAPNDESFNAGFNLGYEDGWSDGNDAGLSGNLKMAELMGTVMNSVASIFSIAILGNITLGTLALFPLLGVMVLFFKKVIQ